MATMNFSRDRLVELVTTTPVKDKGRARLCPHPSVRRHCPAGFQRSALEPLLAGTTVIGLPQPRVGSAKGPEAVEIVEIVVRNPC